MNAISGFCRSKSPVGTRLAVGCGLVGNRLSKGWKIPSISGLQKDLRRSLRDGVFQFLSSSNPESLYRHILFHHRKRSLRGFWL